MQAFFVGRIFHTHIDLKPKIMVSQHADKS